MDAQTGGTHVISKPTISEAEATIGNSNVWNVLELAVMSQMTELTRAIQEIAPVPGTLVYVEAKRPSFNWNGWQPILFSAIDVCTHLQIARIYLTPTQASAVDFLRFTVQQYPFAVRQVRTIADPVFTNQTSLQSRHPFTTEAREFDIRHTIVLDQLHHPILRVLIKYLFGGTLEGTLGGSSEEQVMTALVNFLFFNNNYRSLPTLGGLTPLQKLNQFEGYEKITGFDPYRPIQRRKAATDSRRP
jgi:hypothetical protein